MESLKGCLQQLDTKNMPQFLDQVSDARDNEASRHFAISLYAELAQMHKQAIIPYIPRMMASIVRSLPFSADTQQLHETCAKVVTSVARYTVDPTKPYDSNQQVLFNLCSPLLPALGSKLESSAAGAAVCLQALVESEKWKFAHPDLQDLICSKATAALAERGAHTVALLHLVKSLAKFSKEASQGHVAEWLRIGLQVLQADLGIWQQRVAAAQLIAIILKTADAQKLGLDLHVTVKILEVCLMDKVTVVQVAAAKALETVKSVALEERSHQEVNPVYSTPGGTELLESSCESRQKNSDTEESGLQDLSDSISPRSAASSHEAVPSMASSTVKFGMGPKHSKSRAKISSCLSHASPSLSRPSKLKENTPATMPRRVLSEIPASGKLFSNSEVLPSSCVSKPLRRSSVDLGSKVCSYAMQNHAYLGSEKSIKHAYNPIHDRITTTISLVKTHVEGCQKFSNMGCTCMPDSDEDGRNHLDNMTGGTDNLNGKAGTEAFTTQDDCVEEEGKHRLPVSSSHRIGGVLNDYTSAEFAGDMLNSGCTDDAHSAKDTSKGTRSENLTALDKHLKVAKAHVPSEGFAYRAPSSLLHSLQSKSSVKTRGSGCKECRDADTNLPRQASSDESEEGRVDCQSRDGTSGASCCTVENFSPNVDSNYESGSCIHRQNSRITSDFVLNDRRIHAAGHGWLSSGNCSDCEIDGDEKVKNRLSDSKLHRSLKENECLATQMEGHTELSAVRDLKFRGVHYSEKCSAVSEVLKKQMCVGAGLGLVCAVGILVLAVMVMRHADHSHGLHALVPT
eukprot:c24911_g7_i1 orf=209-2596(-)